MVSKSTNTLPPPIIEEEWEHYTKSKKGTTSSEESSVEYSKNHKRKPERLIIKEGDYAHLTPPPSPSALFSKKRKCDVKPGKNLIFMKNGKNSKITEMVQGSLNIFLNLE